MNVQFVRELTDRLLAGDIAQTDFVAALIAAQTGAGERSSGDAIDGVCLDFAREQRCGFPEVIYGPGKSLDTLIAITERMLQRQVHVLITRVAADVGAQLEGRFPNGRYHPLAKTFRCEPVGNSDAPATRNLIGKVPIVAAGTTDMSIAEEARETLDWMGVDAFIIGDVGVAGPHRLPLRLPELLDADVIVAVAGMEAALPSIIGGYVGCPVIGVPTSVGYGANLGGIAALLSMLNSCAANVTVVNIDAGFKGGYLAGLIATQKHRPRTAAQPKCSDVAT